MNYREIKKVNKEKGRIKLDDFLESVEFCYNLKLAKNKIKKGLTAKKVELLGLDGKIKCVYKAYEKEYVLSIDNKIYVKEDSNAKFIGEVNFTGEIISCEYSAKDGKYLLLSDGNKSYMINEKGLMEIALPSSQRIVFYKERLYLAKGKEVYFSKIPAINMERHEFECDSFFNFDKEEEKVLEMIALNKNLYVFFEKSVIKVKLSADKNQMETEKLETPFYNIFAGSISKVRDKITFIADGKIYTFDGQKFSEKQEVFGEIFSKDKLVGKNFADNYLLKMTAKKKAKDSEYVLVFNVNSQELYLANANSIELFDYGYCIERDKNAIQKLGEEGKFLGDSKKGVIKFKKVDFFGEEKTIKEIEISAKGDYLLKVRIGRNTKIFRLTSGKKKVPIYIKGEEVDVEIETGDIKFELDSIELIYNE